MDDFKKQQNKFVPVGGLHCPCCNDHYGKNKPILNRWARRGLKKEDQEMVDVEMEPFWNSITDPTDEEMWLEIEEELFDLDSMKKTEYVLKRIKQLEKLQKYFRE